MKYFALQNLRSLDTNEVDAPAAKQLDVYPAKSKEDYRKWCVDEETRHTFYSACEGLTPSSRITKENTPKLMHGLVVDYDAKANAAMEAAIADNGAKNLLPQWISSTFSGGRRLVWVFEEPILIDHKDLTARFMKWLSKELKCNNILPGLDSKSFDPTTYFELGQNWRKISDDVVPSDLLSLLIFKAANENQLTSGEYQIPIEVIAEEVEKRFPNRWKGSFTTGARGPLFWIDDGVDRVGCQVGDFGMICYSERAGAAFRSWGSIFGREFVRDYEAQKIGAAADGIWFDGKHYWEKTDDERWDSRNKEDAIMWLKGAGISAKLTGKETISDAEKVLLTVQKTRKVAGAVPFVLDNREIVHDGGMRFLNVSSKKAMSAAESGQPSQFPWLNTFFNEVWDETQRDHFLAWFKRFWISGQAGRLEAGHALFIAGMAGRGKTLLNQFILGSAMGGFADAQNYLRGDSHFNKECGENALWCVDDSKGLDTIKEKKEFAEAIKKQIATPRAHIEAKFRDAVTIPWAGRIVVTTNVDADSLAIIPALDGTIEDKIMLFKFNDFMPKFLPNAQQEALIVRELPYFLAWLRDWPIPEYVTKGAHVRFGINSYKHEDLIETAQEVSIHYGFGEALDIWASKRNTSTKEKEICISATELLCDMNSIEGLRGVLKNYSTSNIGRTLRMMLKMEGSRVTGYQRSKHKRLYKINLED